MIDFTHPANGWAALISAIGGALTLIIVYLLGRASARTAERWARFGEYQRTVDRICFGLQTAQGVHINTRLATMREEFVQLQTEGGKYLDPSDRDRIHRFVVAQLNVSLDAAEAAPGVNFDPFDTVSWGNMIALTNRVVVALAHYRRWTTRRVAIRLMKRVLRERDADREAYEYQYRETRDTEWTPSTK